MATPFERAWAIVEEDLPAVVEAVGPALARLAGKTVLVTGAAGFLPAYMADAIAWANRHGLLEEPARLLLLTRSPVTPDSRLGHLLGRPDVAFVTQDVCAPLAVAEPVHMIVHAASPASPKWFRQDPVGTLDANSGALRQLLELARQPGFESFLYFSSSEIYGQPEPAAIPTPETYPGRVDVLSPRACYAEAKRFGETLCKAYADQHGVPVKMVRPFHVHGPGLRLDDGRIVCEMIATGLAGRPFELLSDGRATRTYGYVSDATAGFLQVLLSDANGEAFNVGTDAPETSIRELATAIAGQFGRTEPVKVNDAPKPAHLVGAPDRVCPDLAKMRERFGYAPRVPLALGLQKTIRWFQALREENPHG